MSGKPLAITPRDRELLQEVQRFGALTREHALKLGLFRSKTRANDRLNRLTAAGYLRARPQPLLAGGPRYVYFPGPALLSIKRLHSVWDGSDLFLHHHLGIVDIRIAFERHTRPQRWLSERDLAGMSLGIVPDAYIEYEHGELTFNAFVEYDRGTEPLGRLEAKARAYTDLAFSGEYEHKFGRKFFRALFVTDTAGRLKTMSASVARVTDRVIRLSTLRAVTDFGPAGPIWLRPGATKVESLTQSINATLLKLLTGPCR